MTDLFTLVMLFETARPILQAWVLLSVVTAILLCWLHHGADPRREAGLGRPDF
jgi:hypothetical protein